MRHCIRVLLVFLLATPRPSFAFLLQFWRSSVTGPLLFTSATDFLAENTDDSVILYPNRGPVPIFIDARSTQPVDGEPPGDIAFYSNPADAADNNPTLIVRFAPLVNVIQRFELAETVKRLRGDELNSPWTWNSELEPTEALPYLTIWKNVQPGSDEERIIGTENINIGQAAVRFEEGWAVDKDAVIVSETLVAKVVYTETAPDGTKAVFYDNGSGQVTSTTGDTVQIRSDGSSFSQTGGVTMSVNVQSLRVRLRGPNGHTARLGILDLKNIEKLSGAAPPGPDRWMQTREDLPRYIQSLLKWVPDRSDTRRRPIGQVKVSADADIDEIIQNPNHWADYDLSRLALPPGAASDLADMDAFWRAAQARIPPGLSRQLTRMDAYIPSTGVPYSRFIAQDGQPEPGEIEISFADDTVVQPEQRQLETVVQEAPVNDQVIQLDKQEIREPENQLPGGMRMPDRDATVEVSGRTIAPNIFSRLASGVTSGVNWLSSRFRSPPAAENIASSQPQITIPENLPQQNTLPSYQQLMDSVPRIPEEEEFTVTFFNGYPRQRENFKSPLAQYEPSDGPSDDIYITDSGDEIRMPRRLVTSLPQETIRSDRDESSVVDSSEPILFSLVEQNAAMPNLLDPSGEQAMVNNRVDDANDRLSVEVNPPAEDDLFSYDSADGRGNSDGQDRYSDFSFGGRSSAGDDIFNVSD
ncbi:hypothetical protein Dda_8830 [Drechslerella dactyloides]|uniref:Uncharacterized protein n=1 Tax=Drechslerella dactyloides TaxID=74499 RepID=A0AAD6ITX0_DREDA|nr:hypothetical protein Dda_8830 [Drechslerella dactyloides]